MTNEMELSTASLIYHARRVGRRLNARILATPSGELRNELTDAVLMIGALSTRLNGEPKKTS